MDTFSKNETNILKGVAILFMLFLHLFNKANIGSLYTPLLYIGTKPLSYLLTSCTYPVDFFIILSGYGLYISYCKGKKNNAKRNLKLYVHYWITLLIFVTIGAFVKGTDLYPGDISKIILNITGAQTSYNSETWFIFPYALISLTSPYIFRFLDNKRPLIVLTIEFIICIFCQIILHFHHEYVYSHIIISQPLNYLGFLFPFSLGMYLAKLFRYNKIKEKMSTIHINNPIIIIMIVMIMCAMMSLQDHHIAMFQSFYALFFIILFSLLNRPKWINMFLIEMGKRSTSMWLTHSYFCYHLFHNFIYGFKYPLLIYFVLLLVSYATAIIIDLINKKVSMLF
jgi:peptidoglycan/LPS O-acetylase OafA/YrhL